MPNLRIWNNNGVDYRGAVVALANLAVEAGQAAAITTSGITIALGNGQTLQLFGTFSGNNLLDGTGGISGLRLLTGATLELSITGYNGLLTLEGVRAAMMTGTLFDMFNSVKYRSYGGNGNDVMGGSIENDVLNGGKGADVMAAMSGNDVYFVDHRRDMVIELANEGFDTVRASGSHMLAANVERLIMNGERASTALGNELDNTIVGDRHFNSINGKDGNDILFGGQGADYFAFTTELDDMDNVDRIIDFSAVDDTLLLSRSVFDGIQSATQAGRFLAAAAFKTMCGFDELGLDANDRVIYDSEDGALYFRESDGDLIQFAEVSAGLSLTHRDFLIIA
jgi:Ca2+-binding RTX toxin-like protein